MAKAKVKKTVVESKVKDVPDKMRMKSDGNVLEHVSSSGGVHIYKYTKSITKKGSEVPIPDEHLAKLIRNKTVEIIK